MSFNLNKKESKEAKKQKEEKRKEYLSKFKILSDKLTGVIQIRSNKFVITSQKRLEFDVETGEKIRTGTRYVLLETINRKLIFRTEDLSRLLQTLDGELSNPFSLQLYNDTFRLKIVGLEKVRTLNFLKKELEGLTVMIEEFIKLCEEFNLFEEQSSE